MKSFKGYLEEAQAGFNTKDMIFTNADTPALILSPTALERAFGTLERIKAWHVTDLSGLKGLIKLQGKKSSISVMTEIEPSDHQPFEGIETGGGFVVELEGTELVSMDQDAWSERLEGGRRGISVTKELFPNMYRHLEFMVKKIYEKYSKEPYSRDSRKAGIAFNKLGQTLSQKEKGQFIKEYIDNCETILTKNKRARDELRKYGRAMNVSLNKKHFYNESVVNQISIKNVYVSKEWADYVGKAKPETSNPHSDLYDPSKSSYEHDVNQDNYMPVSLYTKNMERRLKSLWKNFKIISESKIRTLINKKSIGLK